MISNLFKVIIKRKYITAAPSSAIRIVPKSARTGIKVFKSNRFCVVKNCRNPKSEGISLFKIPGPPGSDIAKAWLEKLKCDKWLKNLHICSEHFKPDEIIKREFKNYLKVGSIPSRNLELPKRAKGEIKIPVSDEYEKIVEITDSESEDYNFQQTAMREFSF
jgi:hypothetical protein